MSEQRPGATTPGHHLRAVYQEICLSYRAIDDFRAKLLGLLPVVSGAGIGLLLGKDLDAPKPLWLPIGLFGFVVTLGLFAYELYGMKKCGSLIDAGRRAEADMNVPGQFTNRPHSIAGLINEPFAAALVYPAVLAGWAFLALAYVSVLVGAIVAAVLFTAGFGVSLLMHQRDSRRRRAVTPSSSAP
jgi:hypothetical protein